DPWAKKLLLTTEDDSIAGAYQATASYPSKVSDLQGQLGDAAYEGVQLDSAGNVWLVEDASGAVGTINDEAKQPNSFVYRLIPYTKCDLTKGGTLQALQVLSRRDGKPIVFHPGQADADITSGNTRDLHHYGYTFDTNWVTVHDNKKDGFSEFSANDLAKAAG